MLSVVTYSFNDHDFVRALLRRLERFSSVVGQVVVVDDGSDAPFAAPPGPFADRLDVVRHAANQGPAFAKRTGLARADGPYILSADSDIAWDALWFYGALELVRDPGVGVVGARIIEKNHGDSLSAARHFASLAKAGEEERGFARGGLWLLRKDVYDAVGGLGDYDRATHEDWHFCRKVGRRGWRVVLPGKGTVLQTRRIGRAQCVRRDALYLADAYAALIAQGEPAAILKVMALELNEAKAIAAKCGCALLVYLALARFTAVFARLWGAPAGGAALAAVAAAFAAYPLLVRTVAGDCGLPSPALGAADGDPGALGAIFAYLAEIVGEDVLRGLEETALPRALAEEAALGHDFHFLDGRS
jgi:hypothetical protein